MCAVRNMTETEFTESRITKYLDKVETRYRCWDAGWYLYRRLMQGGMNRFSTDYLEMAYVLLKAWGMDSRGARLASFDDFKRSIKDSKTEILKLSRLRIEEVDSFKTGSVHETLKHLFGSLKLVKNKKPKFVSFAKAMHFLCPDLVPPMDRKYTLGYFGQNQYALQDNERQFQLFIKIMEQYRLFNRKHPLAKRVDKQSRWNLNLPKVCDNIIIGHYLLKEKKPERTHS
jgi:hypothetical protein